MCSITGIFGKNDFNLIQAMNKSLSYRGPDDSGIFSGNKIELGHNRLSILDVSQQGHQPMHNEDKKVWVVFNGEIYNFQSLKEDLLDKGHIFSSKTDTEVIIHAYEEYGENFLDQLDGMFSFALYDQNKNRLLIVRDRVGVKPLYYTFVDSVLLFSSEIKALFCCDKIVPKMAEHVLGDYFKSNEETTFVGIKELKPGYFLDFKLEFEKINFSEQICYWEPSDKIIESTNTVFNEKEVALRLRELFEESIKQRMVSDVPIALFFSGGIDSTLLTFFAKKYHNNVLKAFTIGTEDRDELEIARQAAEFLNLEFVPIMLTKEEVVKLVPQMIYHLEDYDPRNVELSILIYVLARESKKHGIKVVLCGEGADELFCGYRNFFPDYFKGGEYTKENVHKEVLKWIKGLNNNHLKNKDRGTMATGLELRLPYIDHLAFFEYALSIDPFLKMKDGQEKYILRKMIQEGELPDEVINRKKAYFHIESGIPFIMNNFFSIEGKGSMLRRYDVYKKIFKRIFVGKESYQEIRMDDYR